ncbi:MAG: hypothetical protein WC974_09315 [Thermoplasmata archaeon]
MRLDDNIINELQGYYEAATVKHPKLKLIPDRLLYMVEEVGEAVKEYNDMDYEPVTARGNFRAELFQVAVTALRIIEENEI